MSADDPLRLVSARIQHSHVTEGVGVGIGIGLGGAWILGELVSGFLFQIQAHDPGVLMAVTATVLATGLAAVLVPARRAARVDPLVAPRLE